MPAFHHWHHTKDGPEYINKNYAATFPWVDKCFGTFYLPGKQWPAKYGIDTPMAAGTAANYSSRSPDIHHLIPARAILAFGIHRQRIN